MAAAISLQLVSNSAARFLIWQPDLQQIEQKWVAGQWDDELGWPLPSEATTLLRDASGAKFNPDFSAAETACVSAYGDSFVWGNDIPPRDGWVEQLARKLGCRISNYGVSGYGVDQAFLRFRRTVNDRAPTVILGIYPEAVLRNVNQYRALIGYPTHPAYLKGRFVIDDGGSLKWIARPSVGREAFIKLNADPSAIVPGDYFLPDSRDGPVTPSFPYVLSAFRLVQTPRLTTRFTGRPSWSEFFDANHPSGAFPLTIALTEQFVRDAKGRGKRTLVVMLPGPGSFRGRIAFGAFEYAPMVEALASRGIDVLDVGAALFAQGLGNYCELFAMPVECSGHFGVAGSAVVAEIVGKELGKRALID